MRFRLVLFTRSLLEANVTFLCEFRPDGQKSNLLFTLHTCPLAQPHYPFANLTVGLAWGQCSALFPFLAFDFGRRLS